MLLYFGAERAWEETLWSSQGRCIKVLPAFDAHRIVGMGGEEVPDRPKQRSYAAEITAKRLACEPGAPRREGGFLVLEQVIQAPEAHFPHLPSGRNHSCLLRWPEGLNETSYV